MTDCIQIRGLRILANCGVGQDERDRLQPMEIDLELEYSHLDASSADDLNKTVDYELVTDMIIELAHTEEFSLMETMAQKVVDSLFNLDDRIQGVNITLNKLRPPVRADLRTAGVKIRRSR